MIDEEEKEENPIIKIANFGLIDWLIWPQMLNLAIVLLGFSIRFHVDNRVIEFKVGYNRECSKRYMRFGFFDVMLLEREREDIWI